MKQLAAVVQIALSVAVFRLYFALALLVWRPVLGSQVASSRLGQFVQATATHCGAGASSTPAHPALTSPPFRTFVAPVIGCYMPAKPDDAPAVLEEALADQDSDLGAYLLAHLQT